MNSRARAATAILIAATPVAATAVVHVCAVGGRIEQLARLDAESRRLSRVPRDEGDELPGRRPLVEDDVLARALLAGDGVAPLLSAIARDLDGVTTRDRTVSTTAPRPLGPFQQIQLDLGFTGSFDAAFELLRRISRYERVVRLDRLTMRRPPGAGTGDLTVSIRLSAYTLAREDWP